MRPATAAVVSAVFGRVMPTTVVAAFAASSSTNAVVMRVAPDMLSSSGVGRNWYPAGVTSGGTS
jgi:hypothetical protein